MTQVLCINCSFLTTVTWHTDNFTHK